GNAYVRSYVQGSGSGDPVFRAVVNGATEWAWGIDNSANDEFKIAASGSLGSSDKLTIQTGGNVGIGTTDPGAKLDVHESIFSGDKALLELVNTHASSGAVPPKISLVSSVGNVQNGQKTGRIEFIASDGTFDPGVNAFIEIDNKINGIGEMTFGIGAQGSVTEAMRIDGNGNVGIGTTGPIDKTDIVDGNLRIWDSGVGATSKYDSQGVALASDLHSIILNGLAGDRPEISFYRGNREYPEFSIREHTDADKGATFFTGNGQSAPMATMSLKLGDVGIGTTSPISSLDIYKSQDDLTYMSIQNPNTGTSSTAGTILYGQGNNLQLMAYGDSHSTDANINRVFTSATGSHLSLGVASDNDAIRIDSSGRVGIGTTDPQALLHVDEGSSTDGILFDTGARRLKIVGSNTGSGYVTLEAMDDDNTNQTSRHLILEPNGGRVGIGTTSPSAYFQINSHSPVTMNQWVMKYENVNGATRGGFYINNQDHGQLYLYDSASQLKAFINGGGYSYFNGGNVGIGMETAAQRKLEVRDNTIWTTMRLSGSNSVGVGMELQPSGTGGTNWAILASADGATQGGGKLGFLNSANDTKLIILENGNVGIGTAAPTYGKLSIVGTDSAVVTSSIWGSSGYTSGVMASVYNLDDTIDSYAGLRLINRNSGASVWSIISASQGSSTAELLFGKGTGSAGDEFMRITNAGNVGIGTTAPNNVLHVSGNIEASKGIRTPQHFVWSKKSAYFTHGEEDFVSYIDFGNARMWGWVEVTLTGEYSNANSTGKYTKRYKIGRNQSNAIHHQSAEVPAAFGDVVTEWKLGDFEVDGSNHIRIPIYHLTTAGNSVCVFIEGESANLDSEAAGGIIIKDLTLTEPATVANSETRDYYNIMGGNVGIGTTAPIRLLEIYDNVDNSAIGPKDYTGGLMIKNGNYTAGSYSSLGLAGYGSDYWFINAMTYANNNVDLAIGTQFSGVSTFSEKMRIDYNGNVGIGTTDPGFGLDVYKNTARLAPGRGMITSYYALKDRYMLGIGAYLLQDDTITANNGIGTYSSWYQDYNIHPDHNYYAVGYRAPNDANWQERLRINADGKVGIGTTDPGDLLHVKKSRAGGTQVSIDNQNTGDNAYAGVFLTSDGGSSYIYRTGTSYPVVSNMSDSLVIQESGGGPIVFRTANENVRITNAGNIGIGTTAPGTDAVSGGNIILDINGAYYTNKTSNSAGGFAIRFKNGELGIRTDNSYSMHFDYHDVTHKTAMTIIGGHGGGTPGYVGIGTVNPKTKLEVIGTVSANAFLIAGSPADYVFEDDYDLKSIEEQAAFMWANKHLPALKGAAELDGSISIGERLEQAVEELEKAHVYIEQLDKSNKELKAEKDKDIQDLKAEKDREIQELKAAIEELKNK
ncbi:hypothetical protein ACFL57_04445, partial [Candidatus Margulisiibacteriota bacterium]